MDTISNERPTLQLQLWTGKEYITLLEGTDASNLAERGRKASKAWRVTKPERPLKPKLTRSRSTMSGRTIEDVQRDYLRWAQAKGLLSIVEYSSKPVPNFAPDTIVGYHKRRADKAVPLYTGILLQISLEAQMAVEESHA